MAANQASMARRQRERARMQKRREKQAIKVERRAAAKVRAEDTEATDDPMNDPSIDWGEGVREVKVTLAEIGFVEDEVERSA